MNLTTSDIRNALGDELLSERNVTDVVWTSWSTDSRQQTEQGLFFALVGENFDAHDYLKQAFDNGSKGFIIEESKFNKIKTLEGFNRFSSAQFYLVKNTVTALQLLGAASAAKLNCLKVAITGTSGKTSAKYFCHQILEGYINHYFSPKSFNNHIGVPMTLLDFKAEHKVGLIEIGMNHPNEIETLTRLSKPNVTVVTMVGRGHLEGVGTVEDVLKEKMCIYKEGQTHIINIDDQRIFKDYQKKFAKNLLAPKMKIIKVSNLDESADVFLKITKSAFDHFEIEGQIFGCKGHSIVSIAGEHHIHNILIASAVAVTAGMKPEDVWLQIKNLKPVWGRSEILKSKTGVSIYFDAYNANPESMKAFLVQTQHLSHEPYFILGEMLEMGEHAAQVHFELGGLVAKTPHKKVWFIGPSANAFQEGYLAFQKTEKLMISDTYEQSLALKYQTMLQPNDWVCLKASRGIGLEKFLNGFINS